MTVILPIFMKGNFESLNHAVWQNDRTCLLKGGIMNQIEKYKILSAGKAFGHRAKIALVLLDSSTAYEELKEEASQSMVAGSYDCAGGDPAVILERIAIELICHDTRNTWYLPDNVKFWDRRFGSLFETKFFCYDDEVETWSKILYKFFVKLQWMPKREDYTSTKSYNNSWGYFAELLAVVKQNNHPEFDKYYEIAVKNGMNPMVLERKVQELSEIKQSFVEL